ncbi:MAG: fumarylacetoacetate (FAA) hydrolase, partial [Myxococcota bacterium]
MKLATLDNGTRDGQLLVVRRDGKRALDASAIAPTLQGALDEWASAEPGLLALAKTLADDPTAGFEVDIAKLLAPLPRAYQWVDGSAYLNHVRLVRKARGAEMPTSFLTDPLVYQGGSDTLLSSRADIVHTTTDYGIDFEAELAVVTGDVPYATNSEDAAKHVRLVMLLNDVSLRMLIPAELSKSFGFFQSKPPTA